MLLNYSYSGNALIANKTTYVEAMAWHHTGYMPLPEQDVY